MRDRCSNILLNTANLLDQRLPGFPVILKEMLCDVCAYGSIWAGKPKPGGLPSDFFGGANPPDERKEGDADERYILGYDPVVNFHCRSCWSLL